MVLGAGRSSNVLISTLLQAAIEHDWRVTVADVNLRLAQMRVGNHEFGKAVALDINDQVLTGRYIGESDVVISLLPPSSHGVIARLCIEYEKHLFTASYLTADLIGLSDQIAARELFFLMEMGLDPGIDHMTALDLIRSVEERGGEVTSFKSYTGGLISTDSDNNPWHYKITWNPANVVRAGKGVAAYLEDRSVRYRSHMQLFKNPDICMIDGLAYEGYPNRDSLSYQKIYELENVHTFIRGTLRHKGFCAGWASLIELGLTDANTVLNVADMNSYRELLESFLPRSEDIRTSLIEELGYVDELVVSQLCWLFDDHHLPTKKATMEELLIDLIVRKWRMEPQDKDMVVMQHMVEYVENDRAYLIRSSLKWTGEDQQKTAMSTLVGLPLAYAVIEFMLGKINVRGLYRPTVPEIYDHVLQRLVHVGIKFKEEKTQIC